MLDHRITNMESGHFAIDREEVQRIVEESSMREEEKYDRQLKEMQKWMTDLKEAIMLWVL